MSHAVLVVVTASSKNHHGCRYLRKGVREGREGISHV